MCDRGTYRLLFGNFFSLAGGKWWGWVAGYIQWLGYRGGMGNALGRVDLFFFMMGLISDWGDVDL
jgi:hypothetical protein